MFLILVSQSRITSCFLKLSQILVLFWLTYLTSLNQKVNAQCPPDDKSMKVITQYMTSKLNDIRKYKPGINPKGKFYFNS